MGLRTRIKKMIKERIKGIQALASLIHEEANYPGRPQPHMASRNPLYNGGDVEETPTPPQEEPATSLEQAGIVDVASEDGDFWYLRGDDEGWSDPNPGQEK